MGDCRVQLAFGLRSSSMLLRIRAVATAKLLTIMPVLETKGVSGLKSPIRLRSELSETLGSVADNVAEGTYNGAVDLLQVCYSNLTNSLLGSKKTA